MMHPTCNMFTDDKTGLGFFGLWGLGVALPTQATKAVYRANQARRQGITAGQGMAGHGKESFSHPPVKWGSGAMAPFLHGRPFLNCPTIYEPASNSRMAAAEPG